MQIEQRAGGAAALIQGSLWIVFVIFITLINPRLGIASPLDLSTASVLLPALHRTPWLILFPGLDIAVGLSLFVAAICLQGRFQGSAWMRYATPAAMGAALLFIVLATSRLNSLPALAAAYAVNPSGAGEQFLLLDSLHSGLTAAIRVMLALWLGGTGMALRQRQGLPLLTTLALLAALVNTAGVFITAAGGLNILIFPLWFFALGRWLLRTTE